MLSSKGSGREKGVPMTVMNAAYVCAKDLMR